MTKTTENLQAAFAGESQANRRYLAFAKAAEREGFPQVARLFRAAAAAETVHALSHFRAMQGVKSTAENLKTAIQGENYEVTTMYPGFIEEAKTEMMGDARTEVTPKGLKSFKWAMEAEKDHEALYREALENLGKDQGDYDYYVCPVCGHTIPRSAPDKCPVCSEPGANFERIH